MKVTYALQKDMLYPDLEKNLEKDDNWSRVNVSKSPRKLLAHSQFWEVYVFINLCRKTFVPPQVGLQMEI